MALRIDHPSLGSFLKFIVPAILIFTACSKTYNPNIERGSMYTYREGYPDVRVDAIGLFDEQGNPGINVAMDIVYGSLIYKDVDNQYTAHINVDIQVVNTKDQSAPGKSVSFNYTIKRANKDISQSGETLSIERRIQVDPGQYTVNVTVTDLNTKKETTRSAQTEIPDKNSNKINLTNVMLLGNNVQNKQKKGFIPIPTYDIPGKIDTLRFEFQVTKPNPDNRLEVDMKIVRFASDTLPARPMFAFTPSPSSMPYVGIDYHDQTVVQSQKRILTNESGSILIQYVTPTLKRGNYRFEVNLAGQGTIDNDFKGRDFSVKSENYPNIESPEELARPLYYLMKKKNYEKMMKIKDPDSLKRAVDTFWLTNLKSEQKARSVIKLYYERVEEANKQFSNFKEGWKTDEGMIFILFGPPYYVYSSLDQMQWTYGYDRSDPQRNFYFHEHKIPSKFYPFNNYVLIRQNYYFSIHYQRIQDWLNGYILTRDLF